MRILVVNGPNLDLLGRREPETYGSTTLADLESMISAWASSLGVDVELDQTASEERIISAIHHYDGDAIVINPGAFTHTSHAIADAIRGVGTPVVEVHISNVKARERWRAHSVVSDACVRTIFGRGVSGYRDAMRHIVNRDAVPFETVRYGPHRDNVGDLRRGGGDLVVLVHGGIWMEQYERDTTESLAVDLTRRGFDTWNVEYRRLGGGGGWPASGHDMLMALEFIPQMQLGSDRVVIVSHSAGSHLAMWAAPRASQGIDLHVALAPLLDLQASIDADDVCAPGSRTMIESGSPGEMSPDGITTAIAHGDDDEIVPIGHTIAFASRHGVEHHHTTTGHFALLDPAAPEWAWALERMGVSV